jgi:hypothetical protein
LSPNIDKERKMKINKQHVAIGALMVGSAVLALSLGSTSFAEKTKKKTSESITSDPGKAAERSEKSQDLSKFEVKKSHQEHLIVTEKEAAKSIPKKK